MTLTDIGLLIAACAMFGIFFPHTIYPLLLRIISVFTNSNKRSLQGIVGRDVHRSIDVCLSAYNEAAFIGDCLISITKSNYPKHLIRIFVGDDGSSDTTVSTVESIAKTVGETKILISRYQHSGKNFVMNSLLQQSTADIVVCTDADCVFDGNALSGINATFSDECVGAVVGVLKQDNTDDTHEAGIKSETAYRKFETKINILESVIDSTVTSNGSLFAVRRELVKDVSHSKMADDWVNLLGAIQSRWKVVLNSQAIVVEKRRVSLSGEVRRTIRTASSGMATLWHYRSLLSPMRGWVSFFLLSHRIIRWASPLFLIALMIGTILTIDNTILFGILFYGQLTVYALALLGYAASVQKQNIPVVSAFLYFVAMNYCFFIAMIRFIMSKENDKWNPNEGISHVG